MRRSTSQEQAIDKALAAAERAVELRSERTEAEMAAIESLQVERIAQLRREIDEVRAQAAQQFQALAELKANELLQVERVESLRREAGALRLAGEKAIEKSEMASTAKFESVNEFRQVLTDQAATFARRAELEAAVVAMLDKIDTTNVRIAALDLRAKDALPSIRFQQYTEQQESIRRDTARQRSANTLGVALAMMAAAVSIVLSVVR